MAPGFLLVFFFFLCKLLLLFGYSQEVALASLLKRGAMEHFFVGELEKVLVFTSSYTLYLLLSLYYFVQNPSILSFFYCYYFYC